MEHWIEYTKEYFDRLYWKGVSKMIKTAHHHRDQFYDLTSREVDLAFGLKDKQASKNFYPHFPSYFPIFQCIWFV
jgi:hypothetical protein